MAFMTLEDLKTIDEELYQLAGASTKALGAGVAARLMFKAGYFDFEDPYDRGKLKEAIRWAERASGRSRNKEDERSYYRSAWFRFESNMKGHIQKREAKAAADAREVKELES